MDLSAPFRTLPGEILFIIFGHLDVVSKIRLRRVAKKWNWMLRDPSVWRTVEIMEQEHLMYFHRLNPDPHDYLTPPSGLLEMLSKADVFKHVKHLVLEGDYDLADRTRHYVSRPYTWMDLFHKVTIQILKSKTNGSDNFEKLESIVVRKIQIELDSFMMLTGPKALKCRLTVDNGSIVATGFGGLDEMGGVEFEIPESKTFTLSGESAWLIVDQPVVRLTQAEGHEHKRIPLELAAFVAERCNNVPAEAVAQLGERYSKLLKGREGFFIRMEVQSMFLEFASAHWNAGYDPRRKHWEQCKGYDFNSVRNWLKYAFVSYARAQICYIPVDEIGPFLKEL